MRQKYLRAFVAGSSFLAILIPLTYMGIAVRMNPDAGFDYFSEVFSIAILFGLLNMLFVKIRDKLPFEGIKVYWFFGALHGLFFSLLGNFWLNVPEKLFMLSGWVQYLTIPVAMILYSLIWRFIMSKMNQIVGLDK